MSKMKKITASVLALTLGVFSFTACGKDKIDKTKTQLYVGVFEGGIGSEWAYEYARLFEEKYATESFETGKTGVEVIINVSKDKYVSSTLASTIAYDFEDVYFLLGNNYYNYASQKLFADITDVVNSKIDGEDKTILQKMTSYADYYQYEDGSFYAIPLADSFAGIVYDMDLFKEKQLYFKEGGGWTGSIQKSKGPDGLANTYDDGLPSSWEEFKTLLSEMISINITPFTWCGKTIGYRSDTMWAAFANEVGEEQYNINYTFDGTATLENGESVDISNENAYRLQEQAGKKYAIEIAQHLASDSRMYSSNAFDLVQSHTGAQLDFISSVSSGGKRIAMLFEGTWWENEARDTRLFAEMGGEYDYGKRNFGFMPFPKKNGSDGGATTLLSTIGNSCVAINAATKKSELAKLFVSFTTSEECLRIFTKCSGVTRPYAYELTETETSKMTTFGKQTWNYYHDDNTVVVSQLDYNKMRMENSAYLNDMKKFTTKVGQTYDDPFSAFKDGYVSSASAYFDGLKNVYTQELWNNQFKGKGYGF